MADRDDHERRVDGGAPLRQRVAERAQQRERLEVDAGQLQAGLLAGGDVAVDELAVGDDEQDPPDELALVVRSRSPRTW